MWAVGRAGKWKRPEEESCDFCFHTLCFAVFVLLFCLKALSVIGRDTAGIFFVGVVFGKAVSVSRMSGQKRRLENIPLPIMRGSVREREGKPNT